MLTAFYAGRLIRRWKSDAQLWSLQATKTTIKQQIQRGQVADHDRSYLKLARRVKRKYKSEYSKLALGYVAEKPIDLILLEYENESMVSGGLIMTQPLW